MRRSILATTVVAGLALALSACGGTSNPTSSTSAPASAAKASGTLTIWADETQTPAFKKLGEDFKAQSGITLDVVQKPSGDIRKEFIAQAPTGNGPDLIATAHDNTGELVKNGVVAKLEIGDKLGGLSKVTVNAFKRDGALYGVPYATDNVALVRNNKLVNSTPKTMDELLAAKPAGAQYPILVQQGDQGDAYHLYPIQSSFGATVFKLAADGSYTSELGMEGDAGHKFAAYLKKLADAGALSASMGGDQATQAFIDGKSPYIITGPWNISKFKSMDIAVLPVPSAGGQPSAPFLTVQGVYLSAHSKQALLANQFLDYLAGDAAQQKLYELGGRAPASTAVAGKLTDPILKGFAESAATGAPMPSIPEMGSIFGQWGNTEIAIINGKVADPAAAWDQMITNIKGLLKK